MNPGIFVLGGGGGAGGSGAGRGKGKAGKQGAKGKNGGKDATGGGKNAGACGAGSGGGCPNPSHGNRGTAAGDPVDPISGRVYTVPVIDLSLPGLIPFAVGRSYSSASAELDVGLGYGWSHSYGWLIEERRRTVVIHTPHAAPTRAQRPEIDGAVRLPCGTLRRLEGHYTIDAEGLTYVFAVVSESTYRLSSVHDANGNAIRLIHEGGQLTLILDSVGRVIRVARHRSGRIAAFEVKNAVSQGGWVSFATYEHDERGDLVRVADAQGNAHLFEYDEDHRMIRRSEPGGLVVELAYDASGRCVESCCRHATRDGLDDAVPATLADGSKAKGFLHVRMDTGDGVTEVVTSRGVRRIEGNHLDQPDKSVFGGGVSSYVYDSAGDVLGYTDGRGNTWTATRDGGGRLVSETNPLGGRTEHQYDDRGFIVSQLDPAGRTTRFTRDAAGRVTHIDDDLGPVASFQFDQRGLLISATLPNGGVSRMAYDAMGNRTEVVEPDGRKRTMTYDFLGRITSFDDERGETTSFTYDACGRLIAIGTPGGATQRYEYDADGNTSRIVDADGRATSLVWGGHHVVTEIVRPNGERVKYRYDREMDLVRVENEKGESHTIVRDAEGRILEERTFDGRHLFYNVDQSGQLLTVREGLRVEKLEYDELGRIVERSTGTVTTKYVYDPMGRLESAECDGVTCGLVYDARGRFVTETVRRGDSQQEVRWTYDAIGRATRTDGPAGVVEVRRDILGRAVEVRAGGEDVLRFTYQDPRSFETERRLSHGGSIVSEHTPDGLLSRRSVLREGAQVHVRPGHPDWVGARALGETHARAYAWSPGAKLMTSIDSAKGRVDWLRDAEGRVAELRSGTGVSKRFGYSAAADLVTPEERRVYGPGGRLLAHGDAELRYDEHGRVIEKRKAGSDEAWSYLWDDADRLTEVQTPAGEKITFVYDPFGRRLEKRVERDRRVRKVTGYLWEGAAVAGERTETFDDGDPVVWERTYVRLPETRLPFAQRTSRNGEAPELEYFVFDPDGRVAALVDGRGERVTPIELDLLGKAGAGASATSVRLPGQYADDETGLHYNHLRYYDPETGCYLSPEPLGLAGSLKAYAYADFRLPEIVDFNGLGSETVIYDNNGNVLGRGNSGDCAPDTLHPAVRAALPPQDAVPAGNRAQDSRGRCSEPAAMSNYLNDYEWNGTSPAQRWTPPPPPPRSCRPGDPGWQQNLNGAMGQIRPNDGIVSGRRIGQPNERRWGACENCSQMIPRLYTMANATPPNNVCGMGNHTDKNTGKPFQTRVFNPEPGFTNTMGNVAPFPGSHPSVGELGTWRHENGQWVPQTPQPQFF